VFRVLVALGRAERVRPQALSNLPGFSIGQPWDKPDVMIRRP